MNLQQLLDLTQKEPENALGIAEIYLTHIIKHTIYFYDHNDNLMKLLTRLFGVAEEVENSDNGVMLKRVINIQDTLLGMNVGNINKWLVAAERP